jgi:hypothetical protein
VGEGVRVEFDEKRVSGSDVEDVSEEESPVGSMVINTAKSRTCDDGSIAKRLQLYRHRRLRSIVVLMDKVAYVNASSRAKPR